MYSAGLRGLLLLGCDLEQSSSDTVCEKVHLYYTLSVKTCVQDPLFQSPELFLAITPSGESLLVHGVFLDGGLVGEIPSCSRMRGILHSPGMTEDFYMSKIVTKIICCANQQGQGLFLQKRVKEPLIHLAWKSACASGLGYATSVHRSSTNTPGVLQRTSFVHLVFSWRIRVDEKPRSDFIPTGF